MSYAQAFKPSAEKELRKLSRDVIPRIVAAIQALGDQPRPHGCVKMSHSESWRIRIGDYRASMISMTACSKSSCSILVIAAKSTGRWSHS
jgi:mRNA interferase RelE/StbE